MAFGIYVHIPYCLQRCPYCDFATYEHKQILPPAAYIDLLKREIAVRAPLVQQRQVDTIFFGGGTPSLLEAPLIVAVLAALSKQGFAWTSDCEITLEINPATVNAEKLQIYTAAGINRFSVGAQTFDERHLQKLGRKHSAQDTLQTLNLLNAKGLDYTFDILFALPQQTLAELNHDLDVALDFSPQHLSTYCLTLPPQHPLQEGRPDEGIQVEMFDLIEQRLTDQGLARYEISNYAVPGRESRHNLLYWTDQPFWGLGLSAHSYFQDSTWGTRFWNLSQINSYQEQILNAPLCHSHSHHNHFAGQALPPDQWEELAPHQALTDFCHTALRMERGLNLPALRDKFPSTLVDQVMARAQPLQNEGLLEQRPGGWALTRNGRLLSNLVFAKFTFLAEDLS